MLANRWSWKLIHVFLMILSGVFLLGCQPSSLEDFQLEGAAQIRSLLEELRKIHRREDLAAREGSLRERFEEMADLMIRARAFQQRNLDLEKVDSWENQALSELLLEEMERVYGLEGGRECIEKVQREAMLRLDAKERVLERLQSSPKKSR